MVKCLAWLAVSAVLLTVTLAVNRPPKIYMQPAKDVYFKPGETVEMPCIANGIPKPLYFWQRNKEDYKPSAQDDRVVQLPGQGTIVINRPEPKDEGIFQCFADNTYGVSASIKVNLWEAKLAQFVTEPRENHRVYAGEALFLQCTPPVSRPKADVYWVVKETDGRWMAINFNKRISMDLEGRLRFTNVKRSDEQGGKAYACMAINYFMRDNAIGPEHTIEVLGTTEQKREAYEFWTSPYDHFGLAGQTLKLKCIFGGNPTPDVYWEKLNDTLPDRASFKSFGQELEIKNLQESDGGQYECMGLNTETTQRATKAFNIRIETIPYWTEEPKDVEAGIGEKATFFCKAGGTPSPIYDWFINGKPLDGPDATTDPRIFNSARFQKPNQNNITLSDLTLDDHMNIQCNASNLHGYVFADVYLNVLAEKPTIIIPPPVSLKVAEGQSTIIDCLVTGKPDPIITWYRDASLITGGRFKIMPKGNLHIKNVVMADAGNFKCQASNIYDRNVTSTSCKLQVRRKTRIESFPLDLEVVAGNDAKFTCSGSTDFDEARNMVVYWEKDDKLVSTNEQRMYQNYQDNSLTISGTIVRDSGVYTCVITNGLDEARAYAFLTVKNRPDAPTGVAIDRCRFRSVDLKWIKGMENNAPVQYFVVQYNTTFNPDQWISALKVEYSQNTASLDLQPWSNYTFRVIAVNKIGQSSPSFHTNKDCRTDPDRPFKNPTNLQAIGSKRNYLVIEWTPMKPIEHNGVGFKYQLTVKERGTTQLFTYNIDDWRNSTKEILVSNKVYTPYLVTLKAKNNRGDAKEDALEQVLYTYEDIPKIRAFNLEGSNVGSSTVDIVWSWDSAWLDQTGAHTDVRGKLMGFKVQFWRANEKLSTFREIEVPLSTVLKPPVFNFGRKKRATENANITITNLSPFSAIELQICVYNNYYVGPPSDVIQFNTYEGIPGPVLNFEARVRGSNSFTLVWDTPALEDRNGILTGYDIGFQTVDGLTLGAFHDRDEQINDPRATSAVLSGLLPDVNYRVTIYARTVKGRGEITYIEAMTTSRSVIGSPQFEVKDITEKSMNVTWVPGPTFGTHVVYYVEYRKEGASDWQQTVDIILKSYAFVERLEKGAYYEVRVVAYDGMNRQTSETKVVSTVGFAAARALASNYGWFIGLILSLLAIIALCVITYLIHKSRQHIEKAPRIRPVAVTSKDPMRRDDDMERESRGDYNDYYKDDRKRNKNRDRDSYDDIKKADQDDDDYYGRNRESYNDDNYRDSYDEKGRDRDNYDDRHRRSGEYDDDNDKRGEAYGFSNADYDKEKGNRESYDDRKYDDEYENYDRNRDPPRYDRPPSYDRTPSYEKPRTSRYDEDDDDYHSEHSRFDEDGYPIGDPAFNGAATSNTAV